MPTALPVIIDCDPGTDDALALLLAFASVDELEVRAVTVVGGNAGLDRTLANALSLVALAGIRVPVYSGTDRPFLGRFNSQPTKHGDNGIGGVSLPPGGPAEPEVAADAIRRILRASPCPVTLVGIGPATNLALVLLTEPTLAAKIERIVLMAGAWGEGFGNGAAEFNARSDPEALAAVLAAGRPVVLATLELTAQALATPARIAALRRTGTGPRRCLQAACDIQASVPASTRAGGLGAPLHDPCAIAWLIRPNLFSTRAARVEVDVGLGPSRGRTNIDRWGDSAGANVMLLETLDADGFFALLGERLARLR
jgi:inosine-uridine nucleoside N-ribohydrolase